VQRTRNQLLALGRYRSTVIAALMVGAAMGGSSRTALAGDTLIPAPEQQQQALPATEDVRDVAARSASADLRPRPLGPARGTADSKRAAAAASPEGATGAGSKTSTLVQTLASLGMVIGIILACGAGFQRMMRSRGRLAGAMGALGAAPSPAGILEVLGRYPLSRGTSLVLLKVDRRVLLLAQGSAGLRVRGGGPLPTTLCEISDPDEVASILIKANEAEGRSIGATFRQALAGFERQHDGVIEEPRPSLLGRLIRRGSGGDRAELIDEHALAGGNDPLRLKDFERGDVDPVGSLRSRLSVLRGGGAA
jgi:flagellar biogenesis protein FliO